MGLSRDAESLSKLYGPVESQTDLCNFSSCEMALPSKKSRQGHSNEQRFKITWTHLPRI